MPIGKNSAIVPIENVVYRGTNGKVKDIALPRLRIKDSVESEGASSFDGLGIRQLYSRIERSYLTLELSMLTFIEQVSSVSKSTIESPPLASSALFGGRKRATTVIRHVIQHTDTAMDRELHHTLDGVASIWRTASGHGCQRQCWLGVRC